MTMTWENYKLIESAQITKTSIKIIQNQRTFVMTPLSTQSFDFHYHKRCYDSDSDFVTSENQPKVLKLLKPELECHGGYIGSPRDQYLGYSFYNSL